MKIKFEIRKAEKKARVKGRKIAKSKRSKVEENK